MSRERHARLQEIFLAAVDLAAGERPDYLDLECAGDQELRREVEELLAADQPLTAGPAVTAPASDFKGLVEGAGSYRVLSEIGRGGMGVVYLAERADGAFQRHVAVKVVSQQAGADSELVNRFRSERQILAALDHPNIARLLDGGALPDGSPFLVMEHVDGLPITEFARSRALPVADRVELFIAVCEAVQAAHQSLVVHRDIKPSNVLVTHDGVPKLVDFGVAKILDPQLADWTVAETRFGHQPLTPRYASPEQLTGGPITTATDVYALGVLLHELLTGALPYRPQSSAIHHWVEAVCLQEPRAPSRVLLDDERIGDAAAGSAVSAASVEGDIDHIVLMALRKEPNHRYATAAELAADLRRHLDGLPIQARPATITYRTRKFLRRHRWAVAAALALVLMAVGFTAGLVRQLRRTEIERDRAETVKNLLVEVFEAAAPGTVEGRDPTAREVLDRGLERVRGGLDDQPEVKATLLHAMGQIYNNLGQLDEAAAAYEQALELRSERREEAPLEYAQSLDSVAQVYLARNELERAEAASREAWTLMVAEVGELDYRAIACLDSLESVLSQMGRFDEAEETARRVVELTLRRLGFESVEAVLESDSRAPELAAVATTLASLGTKQRQRGRYGEAEQSLQQAVALGRRVLGEDHYGVAFALDSLANVYSARGEHERALAMRQEALVVTEAVFGADHPSVGVVRLNQGIELHRLGRLDEASFNTTRAVEIFTESLVPGHPYAALAMSYDGAVEADLGHLDSASVLCRHAVESLLEARGEEHFDVARSLTNLAQVQFVAGRHGEAVESFHRALAMFETTLSREHPEALECRRRAAGPLLALGRYGDVRKMLEPAVDGYEARGDMDRPLASARFSLARALAGEDPGDPHAKELAARALATYREIGDRARAAEVEAWLERGE